MFQNDMKKGQTGMLKDGVRFRIEDNLKGNTRVATVYGLYTDIGSIYTNEIASLDMPDGTQQRLEQTPSQAKQSQKTAALMKGLFG